MKNKSDKPRKVEDRAQAETAISKATTREEIGEFWDSHDFTDFEDHCPETTKEFDVDIRRVRHFVQIDGEVLERARQIARKSGMPTGRLINRWVEEAVKEG